MTNSYGSGPSQPGGYGTYGAQAQQYSQVPGAQVPGQIGYGPAPVAPPEHTNIALLPGEETLFAGDFTGSPILRHIKTGFVVTGDRIIVRQPQYIFFLIKTGYAESSVPIQKISQMTTGRLLSTQRVRAALFSGIAGMFVLMMGTPMLSAIGAVGVLAMLLAVVLLAFAGLQAWLARALGVTFQHVGGGHVHVEVQKSEFPNILTVANLVQQLISRQGSVPAVGSAEFAPRHRADTGASTTEAPIPTPAVMPIQPASNPPAPPTIWRA